MLIHTCCGPCVLPILEYLKTNQAEEKIMLFFDNPNIWPYQEYKKRYLAVKSIARIYKLRLYRSKYNHKLWLKYLYQNLDQKPNSYPENDKRCQACFAIRMDSAARFAFKKRIKTFATTLSVNRFKDTDYINKLGRQLAAKYKLTYETFNLDPKTAHQEEMALCGKHDIYRQKYCGCEFSKN